MYINLQDSNMEHEESNNGEILPVLLD